MEENQSTRNKRIAKIKLYLYFRTAIVMGISLYTSRVILKALGETDFGIYNLVGSAVVLFTFINSAMTSSTQRYLNVSIGQKIPANITKVFTSSILIHCLIAGIFLLLAETVGLWFVTTKLNIPLERENAALWVYQITILTICLNTIRCPYNATIIAYERMDFFAKISIVEAALKLGISFIILVSPIDRLVFYAMLLLLANLLITVWCKIFCDKTFPAIRITKYTDRATVKSMSGFSMWSLLGSGSLMASNQGINMLLNMSFSVIVNAALGIAYQVNTAASTLVSNFQTAFMPQITKSYAANETSYLNKLIYITSRYSFLLCFVVSYPIFLNCEPILKFWLSSYPEYTVELVKIIIITVVFEALAGPLWMVAHARGNIRNYQVTVSCLLMLILVACYGAVRLGYSPVIAYGSRIPVLVLLYAYRLLYAQKAVGLNLGQYIKKVILRCSFIFFVSLPIAIVITHVHMHALLKIVIDFSCATILILFCGLNSQERVKLGTVCTNVFHKFKRI